MAETLKQQIFEREIRDMPKKTVAFFQVRLNRQWECLRDEAIRKALGKSEFTPYWPQLHAFKRVKDGTNKRVYCQLGDFTLSMYMSPLSSMTGFALFHENQYAANQHYQVWTGEDDQVLKVDKWGQPWYFSGGTNLGLPDDVERMLEWLILYPVENYKSYYGFNDTRIVTPLMVILTELKHF